MRKNQDQGTRVDLDRSLNKLVQLWKQKETVIYKTKESLWAVVRV